MNCSWMDIDCCPMHKEMPLDEAEALTGILYLPDVLKCR